MELDRTPEKDTSVSLESLLRLKRYEQPDADFWSRFDRDLERKRLQTMVKRNPWYRRAISALVLRPHPALLLGTAALAVFGIYVFQSTPITTVEQPVAQHIPATPPMEFAESDVRRPEALTQAALPHTGIAAAMRTPARISFSETDFGVDVIAQHHGRAPFRSYHMDLEPASFAVSQEKSSVYRTDSLSLRPGSTSLSVGSASF